MHKSDRAPKWLNRLWWIEDKCAEGVAIISTLMFFSVVSFVMIQVICRYVLNVPCPWAEELARYVWMPTVYLGCAYITHIDKHIDIDLSHLIIGFGKTEKSKKSIAKIMYVYRFAMILVLGGIYAALMVEYTEKLFKIGRHTPAAHVPMWIIVAGMTLGMILICISCLSQVIYGIVGYDYTVEEDVHSELDEVNMVELGGDQE